MGDTEVSPESIGEAVILPKAKDTMARSIEERTDAASRCQMQYKYGTLQIAASLEQLAAVKNSTKLRAALPVRYRNAAFGSRRSQGYLLGRQGSQI